MLPVETLGTFFAASVVMGLAPGPDILFVLNRDVSKPVGRMPAPTTLG